MSEHARPTTKAYIGIFAALIVLTTLTVALSYTSLSEGTRMFLAFTIATAKALLVATIFMHLKYEQKTIIIFAIMPVILAILFILAIGPDVGVVQK